MAKNVDKALDELSSSSYSDTPAYSTWINCIRRFKNTQNVQHAADAIHASVENIAAQLESGNNVIRYIIWAIPWGWVFHVDYLKNLFEGQVFEAANLTSKKIFIMMCEH